MTTVGETKLGIFFSTAIQFIGYIKFIVASGKQQDGQGRNVLIAVFYAVIYSLDNGATWTSIKKGISESTYSWDVPDVKGNKTKCLIKVVGFTGSGAKAGADISDENFTIEVVTLVSGTGCYLSVRVGQMDNWRANEGEDGYWLLPPNWLAGIALSAALASCRRQAGFEPFRR